MQMFKVKKSTIPYFLFALSFITSCTTISPNDPVPKQTQSIINKAQSLGFKAKTVETSLVTYATWEKLEDTPLNPNRTPNRIQDTHHLSHGTAINAQDTHRVNHGTPKEIHVYIEGDGNSWRTRYELSANPTPRNPLSLKLAMQDPHSHVIYIARPCQYIFDKKNCKSHYWSQGRYSEEVVQSIGEVLDQIKQRYPRTEFLLVGFSGGGNLAALLSARRSDIKGLITVAANLDHDKLNLYHNVSPLRSSLNAMHYKKTLRLVPQRHYVGTRDQIVPAWLIKEAAQSLDSECVSARVIKRNTHHKGWEEQWPDYLKERLPCQSKMPTNVS